MKSETRTPLRARRVAQIIAAAAGAVALVGVGATAASAASHAAVDPASIVITNTNGSGSVVQFDTVRVDATWAVPDAAVAGDTFGLQLPAELQGTASGFDLPAPDDPTQIVAHCVISSGSAASVVCTLTEYADEHTSVGGTIWFSATASTTTSSSTVGFSVDGSVVAVPVPGGAIVPVTEAPLPTEAVKSGWQNGVASLTWEILVPGADLAGLDTVTISDVVTPPSATTQAHRNTDGVLTVESRTGGGAWTTLAGWSGGWDATGTAFSIDLDGPFAADRAYRVVYTTVPATAVPGDVYANVANVDGVSLSASQTWEAAGGGNGSGAALVQFAIAKAVAGLPHGAGGDAAFTVRYSYGGGAPQELTLTAGGGEVYSARFPVGSSFALEEIDIPGVDGYTWATPVFSGDSVTDNGDGTATITPAAGAVVHVALTNTATAVVVASPSPSPSSPAPESPSPTPAPTTQTAGPRPAVLAATGGTAQPWLPLLAVCAVVAGAAALTLTSRARRR